MSTDISKWTEEQRTGYAVGLLIAEDLKSKGIHKQVDHDYVKQAIGDSWTDAGSSVMSREEAGQLFTQMHQRSQAVVSDDQKAAGAAYMKKQETMEEMKKTASGMQYVILEEGSGAIPEAKDKVRVHYHGTTVDGVVFDSSVQRGQPAEFGVTQVIQGWQETLQEMQVGEKRKVIIPSHLAYGEQGAGDQIAPGATLIFEITLLDIL